MRVVLKLENVFQRAVEAIRPEVRVTHRVDKLRGDAQAATSFAHGAFEHVADPQLAPDLLHIDRLAL